MTLITGPLITEAKQRSFPFIREDQFSPGQSLSQLAALEQEIQQMFGFTGPDQTSVAATPTTIVATQNATGYVLATALTYNNFKYIDNQGYVWPINMVPEDHFDHPMLHPAAMVKIVLGVTTLFPSDPMEVRFSTLQQGLVRQFWVGNGDTFTYNYVQSVTAPFTTLNQSMNVPDVSRNYIVAALSLNILLNSAELVPPNRLQMAQLQWQEERQRLQLLASKRYEATFRAGEQR